MRIEHRIDAGECRQQSADSEPDQVCAFIPETLRQRVDPVLCAEIIILIDAAAEIGIIVDEIVRAVCDEQSQRQNNPGDEE